MTINPELNRAKDRSAVGTLDNTRNKPSPDERQRTINVPFARMEYPGGNLDRTSNNSLKLLLRQSQNASFQEIHQAPVQLRPKLAQNVEPKSKTLQNEYKTKYQNVQSKPTSKLSSKVIRGSPPQGSSELVDADTQSHH